ncbi:ion transporter [Pelagicoccus sp. SDUM812002]|uniref:potassium channel family protein n=1 Tax=Pelagicoccus sp. SDUM812002 TaxID=3041266 RepID=UPI00280E42B4|nr:ion transporter [Pelagicoccus sp. SDUM812002]MDQ8184694.1 ion transporter [Pelagicoccus sp. SDUM812002]
MNKEKVYTLLEKPGQPLVNGGWLRAFLLALILLNALSVILESVASLKENFAFVFIVFERLSVSLFALEYVLRLWAINTKGRFAGSWGRTRYLFSPMALIDLASILPSLLAMNFIDLRFLRIARLLRLLRILKLGRYSKTLQTFTRVAIETRAELTLTLLAMLMLLIVGSGLMYYAEHEAQPNVFASIPGTMWWAITTLTTVGYGDAYPITSLGKLIASVLAIIGIGMFALPSGILGAAFLKRIKLEESLTCPHCGYKAHEPKGSDVQRTEG